VVGIALSQGEWAAAGGALLLFLTNCLAILLTGGLVFLLVGLGRLAQTRTETRLRRRSFAIIILFTLLIAIPLALSTRQVLVETLSKNAATEVVQDWLKDTQNHLVAVQVNEGIVIVTVEGQGDLKPLSELEANLETALQSPQTVGLRLVPVQFSLSDYPSSP
jgi:uncharacterized membrane protein